MERERLDGVIAATLENNLYMSGIWHRSQEYLRDYRGFTAVSRERPDAGIVVVGAGSAELSLQAYESIERVVTFGAFYREVPDGGELPAEQQQVKSISIDRKPKETALDALVDALRTLRLERARIGIDERGLNGVLLDELTSALPDASFVRAADLFREIRMVKTPEEVQRLVATLRVTERAIRAVWSEVRAGVTERELARVFEETVVSGGARPGFTLIRFGVGAALSGVPAGDVCLKEGDHVLMDVGCTLRGYRSDIGRSFTLGEAPARYRETYEAVKSGQSHAISLLRPGARARDVFRETVEHVRAAGLTSYRRHHVGHAIGLEFYDVPTLDARSDVVIEPGMVFEVETPYYELGFGAAFVEDTVLVEPTGARLLTELDRELLVMSVRRGTKVAFSTETTQVGGGGLT
jgi:Xaa-Pro dipeptidase